MIGDKLIYHSSFQKINLEVISKLKTQLLQKKRICIAVGGESGSGKTSLAYALCIDIQKQLGLKGYLFHGDDYFKLPPKDNHNKRLEDISNVGSKEVHLNLLDTHILAFQNAETAIAKPLVNYKANTIEEELLCAADFDFCVVELTYAMLLKQPSYKIFIENSFLETKTNRERRGRDIMNDFNERVLQIEHKIIKEHIKLANMAVKNTI